MRKPVFVYSKIKRQFTASTSYTVYLKFQSSNHLLWLKSLVCVEPGQNILRRFFFGNVAHTRV